MDAELPVTRTQLAERHVLCSEIGAGGMARVHIGRLLGPAGFARTVAIERLLPRHTEEPELRLMLTDEARLASRVRHPPPRSASWAAAPAPRSRAATRSR